MILKKGGRVQTKGRPGFAACWTWQISNSTHSATIHLALSVQTTQNRQGCSFSLVALFLIDTMWSTAHLSFSLSLLHGYRAAGLSYSVQIDKQQKWPREHVQGCRTNSQANPDPSLTAVECSSTNERKWEICNISKCMSLNRYSSKNVVSQTTKSHASRQAVKHQAGGLAISPQQDERVPPSTPHFYSLFSIPHLCLSLLSLPITPSSLLSSWSPSTRSLSIHRRILKYLFNVSLVFESLLLLL